MYWCKKTIMSENRNSEKYCPTNFDMSSTSTVQEGESCCHAVHSRNAVDSPSQLFVITAQPHSEIDRSQTQRGEDWPSTQEQVSGGTGEWGRQVGCSRDAGTDLPAHLPTSGGGRVGVGQLSLVGEERGDCDRRFSISFAFSSSCC